MKRRALEKTTDERLPAHAAVRKNADAGRAARERAIYRTGSLLAACLIALILLSGYGKIIHPGEFALAVYRYHLLPDGLVNMASLYFAWLETICAVCLLLIPRLRAAALQIVLVLIALFTCAIAINLLRGTSFGCGCFGASPLEKAMGWGNVLRNGALMLLVALALYGRRQAR